MLHVRDLHVCYGDLSAVDHLDLEAADGEVLAVLGPSGCGKSTLLRAIAGLEPARSGFITVDGREVTRLRPDQRDVGLMFQDHALFPHRSVADNVAFGPRMRRLPRRDIADRVEQALALVDLAGTGERAVTSLSGGEQQRVALARAVAARPRLLMLDEPLGSLDRVLRDRLLDELPRVFAAIGTTVLYVTHDQEEALALADRVAVMRAGQLVQVADPTTLWREPATEFVARFVGLDQLLDAEVREGVATTALGALAIPDVPDGPVRLVLLADAVRLADDPVRLADDPVRLADDPVRLADDPVRLADDAAPLALSGAAHSGTPDRESTCGDAGTPGATVLPINGTVTARRFAGDHVRLVVATDPGPSLTVPAWHGPGPLVGSRVALHLDARSIRPVTPDDDRPSG